MNAPTRFTKVGTGGQSTNNADPTKNSNRGDYSRRTFSFVITPVASTAIQLGVAIPRDTIILDVNFNIRTAGNVAVSPSVNLGTVEGGATSITDGYSVAGTSLGYRSANGDSDVPFSVRAASAIDTNVTYQLSSADFGVLDCEVELICALAESS